MELDVAKKDGCSFLYIDIKKTISKGTKLVEALYVHPGFSCPSPKFAPVQGPNPSQKLESSVIL